MTEKGRFISALLVSLTVSGLAWSSEVEGEDSPITVKVNGIERDTELGPEETKIETLQTQDHHCDSDCEGEPTRTPYSMEYSVDPSNYKIIDSKLKCSSGPCAYSGNKSVSNSDSAAWASFDVWSRPTTWTLTITQRPINTVDGAIKQLDSDEVEPGTTFVVDYDQAEYTDIEIQTELPSLGRIAMDPDKPVSPYFEAVGESTFGTIKKYTLKYNGSDGE